MKAWEASRVRFEIFSAPHNNGRQRAARRAAADAGR